MSKVDTIPKISFSSNVLLFTSALKRRVQQQDNEENLYNVESHLYSLLMLYRVVELRHKRVTEKQDIHATFW
jgi:hypothetical protein